MLGLLTLGLTVVMIFKLVKNALIGKQLSSEASFQGTIELIIPMTSHSEFYPEPWIASLKNFKTLPGHLKIHVLIDGHHSSLPVWEELHSRFPFIEVQSFLLRPPNTDAVPWMLEQISSRIVGQIVILGDSELTPQENAFLSLSKLISEKDKSYFVLPQTSKMSTLGEAIAVINPTLALASVFGFRKFRRNIFHPLMSISQGWMGMTLKNFQELNFHHVHLSSWKEAIVRQWDRDEKTYGLAFGEKYLQRYYPAHFKTHMEQLLTYWENLWNNTDRKSFWIFVISLFVWSFPMIFFFTHPFWSLASIGLLILYRFFSKIVFQESWTAIILHPFGCLMWVGTLAWWTANRLKTKYQSRGLIKH